MAALAAAALFVFSRLHTRYLEGRYPPAGKFVLSGGRRWHVLTAGPEDGPVVVLLHGASSTAQDISSPLLPFLSPHARIIAPDRPGHGYSQRFSKDGTPEAQASAIWQLLDELGVREAVLVGHSWSGALSLAMALEAPERVRALVQVAPVMRPWAGRVDWPYRVAAIPGLGHLFTSTLVPAAGVFIYPAAVRNVFAPAPVPAGYAERSATRLSLRPAAFRANSVDMEGLNRAVGRLSANYGRLAMPITVIGGAGDSILSARFHGAALQGLAPQTSLYEMEGEGHMPHYGHAAEVANAIRALL